MESGFTFNARRVVTSDAVDGSILADGDSPDAMTLNGCRIVRLWQTTTVPERLPVSADVTANSLGPMPSPFRGTRFYTAELPAGARIPLHRADQIDYIVVIKGRITLVLEHSELELGVGETLVQCGNMHGWENRAAESCVIAVVAVGAQPAA